MKRVANILEMVALKPEIKMATRIGLVSFSKLIALFCFFIDAVNAVEPASLACGLLALAGSAGVMKYRDKLGCMINLGECCDSNSIKFDYQGLSNALESQVYGQHLVRKGVLPALKNHYTSRQPSKALALSFHGITGSGKNHVSNLIVDNIYKKGRKSKFVHFYSATHHFPHKELMSEYQRTLREEIIAATKECEQAIFIFDEMDKMPPSLIDIIGPYLDFYDHLGGVDYRRTTFLFLSNAGGVEISRFAVEHWKSGKTREEIQLAELQPLITLGAYSAEGGWWHSSLMEKHLINVFIPFLPLEQSHVKKCIVAELSYRRKHCDPKFEQCNKIYAPTDTLIKRIVSSISFFPSSSPVFANAGCKRITDAVNQALLDED